MLGKLFKHEWKDSFLFMIIMNGSILLLSILGAVFFGSMDVSEFDFERPFQGLMYGTYVLVYVVGIFVLFIGSTIYFYVRFFRNMYTDQGYLMHTLPVTEHELILSKLSVAMIWKIISTIVVTFGLEVIAYSIAKESFPTLREIKKAIQRFDIEPGRITLIIILSLLFALGYALYTYLLGYASVSVGQFAVKNKVIASVGAFIGIRMILRFIRNLIMITIGSTTFSRFFFLSVSRIDDKGFLLAVAVSDILVYIACAALYLITHMIMKNRLNLE
ncbi:MAG: hypothetical protein J6Z05_07595 [Lachnospiraceae bacterium]|nr:hypothetical protein [Lachnospiraceae bacterium]